MNMKVALTTAFVALLILLAAFGKNTHISSAQEVSTLAMPEEYVNYAITRVDGVYGRRLTELTQYSMQEVKNQYSWFIQHRQEPPTSL
jgi:hypothetical protein